MGSILEALSPEQQIACSTQNNILLTACPGSGKTRTLTHRLAYQVLRDPASKKIKIAITYTNRAAEEITNRLEGMNIGQVLFINFVCILLFVLMPCIQRDCVRDTEL